MKISKWFVLTITLVVMMMSVFSMTAMADSGIQISPVVVESSGVKQLEVTVSMPAGDISSLDIYFDYNGSDLEYVEYKDVALSGAIVNNVGTKVKFVYYTTGEFAFAGGALYTVVFNIKDDATISASDITIDEIVYYASGDLSADEVEIDSAVSSVSCPHYYDDGAITTPASCTAPGVKTYTCTVCGHSYEDPVQQLSHDYVAEVDADYLKSAATCEDAAVYYKSCSVCGTSSKGTADEATFESGAALGHKYEGTDTSKATKATDGDCVTKATYYYYCVNDDCGKSCKDDTAYTGPKTFEGGYGAHKGEAVEMEPATCVTTGTKAHYKCTVDGCGKLFEDANCTEEILPHELIISVDTVNGHKKDSAWTTENGKHYHKCLNDGCTVNLDETSCDYVEPANPKSENLATAANCVDPATYYKVCVVCDASSKNDSTCHDKTYANGNVNPQVHKEQLTHVAAKSPDCKTETNGNIEHWYCKHCEAYFEDANGSKATTAEAVVVKFEHSLSNTYTSENGQHWKECTADGCDYATTKSDCTGGTATCVAKAKCSICEKEYGDKDENNHVGNTVTDYDTDQHWTECDACGADANDKKDHSLSWLSDGKQHWQECSGCDYATTKSDCSAGTAATCEKDAVCGTCGKDIADTMLEHSYTGEVVAEKYLKSAATCESYAVYKKSCVNGCGAASETETFEDVAGGYGEHDLDAVAENPATCVETGTAAHYKCSVCGDLFKDEAGTEPTDLDALELPVDNENGHKADTAWKPDDENDTHYHDCLNDGCTEKLGVTACTGGTATCVAKAKCPVCDQEYGDVDPDNHDLSANPGTPATCSAAGVKAHWTCSRCDVIYAFTENGNNGVGDKITDENRDELYVDPIAPNNHDWVWGKNETGHWQYCNNANAVNEYCYELKDPAIGPGGDSFPGTAPAEHTFGDWVTANGYKTKTCECGYYISEKVETTETGTGSNIPGTGDETPIALWSLAFLFSGAAITALVLKKKEN